MLTGHRDQASVCPFALREVSVLAELALGHLHYSLTYGPPQSNSPPGSVLESRGSIFGIGRDGFTTTLIHLYTAIEYRDNQVETPAHTLRPTA